MWLTVNESLSNLCSSPFWDTDATWNSPDPDFTLCSKKTVLIWFPCLFLWLFLPLEIYYLRHTKAYNIPFDVYNIVKLVLIAILGTSALTDIANYIFFDAKHVPVDIYSPVIKFLTFCLFFVLTYANIKCGIRSSGVLFLFSFFLAFFGAPQFRTELRSRSNILYLLNGSVDVQKVGNHEVVDFVSYIIYYPLVLTVLFLNCFADARPVVQTYPVDKNVCPEIIPRSYRGFFSRGSTSSRGRDTGGR